MNIGSLRSRVQLQGYGTQKDILGQPIAAWADLGFLWADIRFVSGLEAIKSDASVSVVKASVRIRYRADVKPAMRLLHSGVVFDIKAVLPDPKRAYMDLVCEAGANNG